MLRKLVLLVLVLSLSACSLRISLPFLPEKNPSLVEELALDLPEGSDVVDLDLKFGAGKIFIKLGSAKLLSGTATYNIDDLKPILHSEDGSVTLEQGKWQMDSLPGLTNLVNEWDLKLGQMPLDLTIEAGAYRAEFEFGGLALVILSISDGAADVELRFSEPNLTEMTLLRYQTGASNVSMIGLANANFSSLEFDSGAGNYTLDFSGVLLRPASVSIETGVSNMTLVIPDGIPVQITVEGSLSNVSHGPSWAEKGSRLIQEGSGPQLTIIVEMGAGNLTITR